MFVYCKCYISIELTFLKELMLTKQMHQRSVIFVTIDISYIKVFNFNQTSVVDAMMSTNLSDIAILNIKGSDYHCIINGISESEAIKFMQNTNLIEKSGTLKNLLSRIKMGIKNVMFDDIEIKKANSTAIRLLFFKKM